MRSNNIKSILLIISILLNFVTPDNHIFSNTSAENDTTFIYLRDYGLEKMRKKNCINVINKALKDISGTNPKVLIFPRGEFHFYPDGSQQREYYESNTTDTNPKNCAFLFENVDNLIIDGKSSNLIFHEQMQPFTFDNCNNIVLQNVNIDWEEPLTAQARVLKANDEFIELSIDLKQYSYRIDDGKLFFTINRNVKNPWKSTMEFDQTERYIVPQTGDRGCLGRGWENYIAENVIPGIIRLNNTFLRKPAVGNILILRHSERSHSGIFIQDSKNITVKNVNLYHAAGLGILAQFSENLTFEEYHAVPNRAKNRYFGGGDDGLQVSNCKGQIVVNNCEFSGLMDDPINVHGTSVQVVEKISDKQIKCKFMHHQSVGLNWGHAGDRINFIENSSMKSIGTGEVARFEPINVETFILTLKNPLPAELEITDALENLTWAPDVEIKNSHFKSCRARGILISTPGKVVIENNIFESSGSAILIAGDANNWFESGAVTNVLIQNNNFTELCNTSSYQFCEGIISIYPEIPELNEGTPPFHKNIRIENNQFHPFDYPVLFARSVNSISFKNNTVTRSTRFEPWHNRQYTFSFEACTNITVANNQYSEEVLGKNIYLKWTRENELNLNEQETLLIESFIKKNP